MLPRFSFQSSPSWPRFVTSWSELIPSWRHFGTNCSKVDVSPCEIGSSCLHVGPKLASNCFKLGRGSPKVEQVGFDRVLMFRFDTKHGQRSLSVELFRNGNVILMDENDVILQPLTHASYSGRTIKKGEIYVPPPAAIDPYNLTLDSLNEAFDESDRDLVSTLGGKINLGGIYANAVCEHAGLEPNSSTDDADASFDVLKCG